MNIKSEWKRVADLLLDMESCRQGMQNAVAMGNPAQCGFWLTRWQEHSHHAIRIAEAQRPKVIQLSDYRKPELPKAA